MPTPLVVVDSFTSVPFKGNPAAVALVDEFPSEERMQMIAREMNLSETAFVVPKGHGDYDLRWFTPTVEIELCGHATLASAHVVTEPARFHTMSGVLTCGIRQDGWITMDFPANPPTVSDKPSWFDLDGLVWFGHGRRSVLIELDDPDRVRSFTPDFTDLVRVGNHTVVITARIEDGDADFVSRVFGPAVGIAEDPVTGAAHCMLAEFWGERLNKIALVGEQASLRGGIVQMLRQGDRIELAGQAVTVAHVTIEV